MKEEQVQEILAKYFKSPITIMYGHLPNCKRQPKILKQHARMLMELREVQQNVSFSQSWLEERLRIVSSMKTWRLKELELEEFAEKGAQRLRMMCSHFQEAYRKPKDKRPGRVDTILAMTPHMELPAVSPSPRTKDATSAPSEPPPSTTPPSPTYFVGFDDTNGDIGNVWRIPADIIDPNDSHREWANSISVHPDPMQPIQGIFEDGRSYEVMSMLSSTYKAMHPELFKDTLRAESFDETLMESEIDKDSPLPRLDPSGEECEEGEEEKSTEDLEPPLKKRPAAKPTKISEKPPLWESSEWFVKWKADKHPTGIVYLGRKGSKKSQECQLGVRRCSSFDEAVEVMTKIGEAMVTNPEQDPYEVRNKILEDYPIDLGSFAKAKAKAAIAARPASHVSDFMSMAFSSIDNPSAAGEW